MAPQTPVNNRSLTTSSMNVQQSPNHSRFAILTPPKSDEAEMALGRTYLPTDGTTNTGMAVSGGAVSQAVAKRVDQADVRFGQKEPNVGSVGDVVKASMDQIASTGGPRQQMRGQQNSRNYNENGKAFKSTSNSPDSNSGN